MKTTVLAQFFTFAAIHLHASLKQDRKLRSLTKPFILPLLTAYYCLAAEPVIPTVVLALMFSWLGDVLLIPRGMKWFAAGGVSFMASHIFFILSYAALTDLSKVGRLLTLLLPAVFFISAAIAFRCLRPHLPRALFFPMFLYLLINGAMNCFAWFRSLSTAGGPAVLTAVGALLFYVSDLSDFFVRFNKESRLKTHFLVMLTYIAGEFLIVLGLS